MVNTRYIANPIHLLKDGKVLNRKQYHDQNIDRNGHDHRENVAITEAANECNVLSNKVHCRKATL